MRKIKLSHWKIEMRKCIARFKKHPNCTHAWCCHHQELMECVDGLRSAMHRIRCIARQKDECERAVRFHNFRPVTGALGEELDKLQRQIDYEENKRWALYRAIVRKNSSYNTRIALLKAKLHKLEKEQPEIIQAMEKQREAAAQQCIVNSKRIRQLIRQRNLVNIHKKDVPDNTWGVGYHGRKSIFGPKTRLC